MLMENFAASASVECLWECLVPADSRSASQFSRLLPLPCSYKHANHRHSLSLTSFSVIKFLTTDNNLRVKACYWFTVQGHKPQAQQQYWEVADHMTFTVRKPREMDAGAQLQALAH